jgi:enoyl-CoA hydratase/carnithine racemase
MITTELLQSSREGRLLRLILNRPEKRNALNAALCRDLNSALAEAQNDPEVGAILLTSNGKSFSAGMDLNESLAAEAAALADLHDRLFTAFVWLDKPLIAAVQGAALAGGTGLVANAHIAISADDATFGLTEIHIGLWPFLVFRAVVAAMGERRTMELSLSGRIFGAAEAQSYGLVHHVVPAAELESRALEIARAVAESSPMAIASGLAFVEETRGLGLEEAGRIARNFRQQIFEGDDFQERVRRFRARKKP